MHHHPATSAEQDRHTSSRESRISGVIACGLGFLTIACVGDLSLVPSGPVPDKPGIDGPDAPKATESPSAPVWRRLTASQYQNTVQDLIGSNTTLSMDPDSLVGGLASVGASRVGTSALGVEKYVEAAYLLAEQTFLDQVKRTELLACTPTIADDECTRSYIVDFGRRAFRRPLEGDEVARYLTLATMVTTETDDAWQGVSYVTAAMLQSPNFLYRLEYGEPSKPRGARRLTSYELASRLSYALWDTTPDDALLDAAKEGELDSVAGLRRQAERLLASPRARTAMRTFFAEYMHLRDFGLPDSERSKGIAQSLAAAMREETLLSMERTVFDDKSRLLDLFASTTTYLNAELAEHYGLPAPSQDWGVVELPPDGPRSGLLSRSAFLVTHGDGNKTKPVARGKFMREVLLCTSVPPPPEGVIASLPEPDPNTKATVRERLAEHRANPSCQGCHTLMDDLGLAFETFDALGRVRTEEYGLRIDPAGVLDGEPFDDARALSNLLANHERADDCFVRTVYRQVLGEVEGAKQSDAIAALLARNREEGGRLDQLFLALVESELFRTVIAPDLPNNAEQGDDT